jgi:hypothetical protein
MHLKRAGSFILLLMVMSLGIIQAGLWAEENPVELNGFLVYSQFTSIPYGTKVVVKSSDTRRVYSFPKLECFSVSIDGRYLATAVQSTGGPTDLQILDLISQQEVFSTEWLREWLRCGFTTDNLLIIYPSGYDLDGDGAVDETEGRLPVFYFVDKETFKLSGPDPIPFDQPKDEAPRLPDEVVELPALSSPAGNLHFYEKCPSGSIHSFHHNFPPFETTYCSDGEWVIYDSQSRQQLQKLSDVSEVSWDLFRLPGDPYAGASWSPDGNYLAYMIRFGVNYKGLPVEIYSATSNTLSDADFFRIEIDKEQEFLWSPDSTKLALWVRGRAGEPEPGDEMRSGLRHLVIYDIKTETYQAIDQPYTIKGEQLWSPDSRGFVFVNEANELIYVDDSMYKSRVIDSEVRSLYGWLDIQ